MATTAENGLTPQNQSNDSADAQNTSSNLPDADQKTFDAEYVRALRKEASENRKKALDAEARLKTLDEAQLSEKEKLEKRAKDLEEANNALTAKLKDTVTRVAIEKAAETAGIIDPKTAHLLLVSSGVLEYDADGAPINLAKVVADLVKEKPYLLGDKAQKPGNGPDPKVQDAAGTAAEVEKRKQSFSRTVKNMF
jgi:hypothetical protein